MEDNPEIVTGEEVFRKAREELGIVRFYSTIWQHSRKWAIPIPKSVRKLIDQNQLYKIEIRFTRPENRWLHDKLGMILLNNTDPYESYVEITKVWKSGNRMLFPITMNTARQLVPKLQKLREAVDIIIEEAIIQEAIDYLLKKDPEYRKLQRKLIGFESEYDLSSRMRQYKSTEKKIKELREKYRAKAEELVKQGFKPSLNIELTKDWIKRPLLITATRYTPKNEREAIAIYRRAPIPADEKEFF